MNPEPSQRMIGDFLIENELGSGAFGIVYRAVNTRLGRPVALKVFINQKTNAEEFKIEGQILAGLSHPNIVVVHDAPIVEGRPMIEMELVPGMPISDWLRTLPPPGFMDRVLLIEQVASGLAYAHSAGVQHRDLKPSNIMVMPNGSAKVLDFGLARRRRSDGIYDPSVGLGGTLTYMAPEQFEKSASSFASDVFAFGIIAYELASCSHPFRKETEFLTLEAIMRTEPPPLRWQVAGVPEELEFAIAKCLTKNPALRPTMQEMEREIRRAIFPMRQSAARRWAEMGLEALHQHDRARAETCAEKSEKLDMGCEALRQLHEGLRDEPEAATRKNPFYQKVTQQIRILVESGREDKTLAAETLLESLAEQFGWNAELHALGRKIRSASKTQQIAVPAVGSDSPVAGEARECPADGLRYVWIPPGEFLMGCSPGDEECDRDEKPARLIRIETGFWLGQTPVTQAAFERVMGPGVLQSKFRGTDLPADRVNWHEASEFARKTGGRLPTEPEWEYAARAGSQGPYYGVVDEIAWYEGNSGGGTHAAGQKLPNAWGLYDILGNVQEWTTTKYDDEYFVVRGGGWNCPASALRVSYRYWMDPISRKNNVGFRCVRDALL